MNADIAKQSVAALRSGKYTQATGQLRNSNDQFCCLGVLCDLHAQAHGNSAHWQSSPVSYLGDNQFLPTAVRQWAQMATSTGHIEGTDLTLINLNDSSSSFNEIATIIDNNIPAL